MAVALGVVLCAPLTAQAAAQQPAYPQSRSPTVAFTPASGRCLTPEQRKVNDAYNALTRPTSRDDTMPFFDPEYFVGTWDFDMRTQESVLGAGGESVGTLTISPTSNGCAYEGTMKGEDPDGKTFTRAINVTYDPVKKLLTWVEKDSRGYTITRSGAVGGELGGLFHHHFGEDESSPPTAAGGKKIRIKGISEMSSPAYYKTDLQISIDGSPFATFGRITHEKQLAEIK